MDCFVWALACFFISTSTLLFSLLSMVSSALAWALSTFLCSCWSFFVHSPLLSSVVQCTWLPRWQSSCPQAIFSKLAWHVTDFQDHLVTM
jgi:hypothetical protein